MIINKRYTFRLYPTKEQIAMLQQHGGNSRFIWNKLVAIANEVKKNTGNFKYSQSLFQLQIKQLKAEHDFLYLGHAQPIQYNAMKLNDAFTKAFSPEAIAERNQAIATAHTKTYKNEEQKIQAIEKARNHGFPKFKKKGEKGDSLFYPQYFIVKKSRILFPKIGWIKYIKHRNIEGEIKSLTIKQDGNQYNVSILVEAEIQEKIKKPIDESNIQGGDVGLEVFATFSDDYEIKNPRTLKKHLKRLKKEQRNLERCKYTDTGKKTAFGKPIMQSSKNRDKQILRVQEAHRKVRNIRNDFLHKVSHHITDKYDGIILETLDIKGMLRKNGKAMNRSISDASWFTFGKYCEYKCLWKSKYFYRIEQYFPSTQTCSGCGHLANLSLQDRIYICPHCGLKMKRDLNASKTIRVEGIRGLKLGLVSKPVRATNKTGKTKMKRLKKKNISSTVANTGIYAQWTDRNSGQDEVGKEKISSTIIG